MSGEGKVGGLHEKGGWRGRFGGGDNGNWREWIGIKIENNIEEAKGG